MSPEVRNCSLVATHRPGSTQKYAQVDGVAFRGDDSIFADHAILLASGNDLAGQEEERPPGIVDEYEAVYLSAIVMNGGSVVRRRTNPCTLPASVTTTSPERRPSSSVRNSPVG